MAVGAQLLDQSAYALDGIAIGREVRELRADMHGDANHAQVRQSSGQRKGIAGEIDVDAELVFLAARGDLGVRLGIDVGVKTQGDGGVA